jgi:hypothetical protein
MMLKRVTGSQRAERGITRARELRSEHPDTSCSPPTAVKDMNSRPTTWNDTGMSPILSFAQTVLFGK